MCIRDSGKGASETSVTIADDVISLGSNAMIKGSVMDISPGTQEAAIQIRFPKGVPAVSESSMNDWMLYVYKQFARPSDVTGVQVKIEAIDPNGNYQNLGTTMTDLAGNYGFTFEPEVPGEYQIIVTFEGSKAYYGSFETTYLSVDEAVTPTSPIEPEEPVETPEEPSEPVEGPLITTEIAIIAAVAVVAAIGVAAYFLLKRK